VGESENTRNDIFLRFIPLDLELVVRAETCGPRGLSALKIRVFTWMGGGTAWSNNIVLCCTVLFNSLTTSLPDTYRGADKSLARPTFRYILFDGKNISFDASLVIHTHTHTHIYIYI
jgi:hypothetical protein